MVLEQTLVEGLCIDRYRVQRLIGEGAMGKVYLAHDPKLQRKVAIKVLGPAGERADVKQRFRLEARAIAALKHPNIVELYDYSGPDAPELYLVMEYVPGASLYDLVEKHGPMAEPVALCAAHELALALEHAHAHNIVHRDLKPENVLLHNGRVVLTDFGGVKAIAADNALGSKAHAGSRTEVLGTPGFMPPEQFAGRKIDVRTDIFSLGAVLYNLTTGELPYRGGSVQEIYDALKAGRYSDPSQEHPGLSLEFCVLMARCLAPNPKNRFAAMEDVREEILGLLARHAITEVRRELADYERDPARQRQRQEERNLEVLLKDLKVALKDRRQTDADLLARRIRALAPDDRRVDEISGVAALAPRRRSARVATLGRSPWASFLGLGFLLGFVAGAVAQATQLLPRLFTSWLGP